MSESKRFWIVILTLSRFESLILPFVNANALSNQAFETRKKGCFRSRSAWRAWFWGLVSAKFLSECDLCVRILEMRSWSNAWVDQCSIGTKYYVAVRRSCSWSGWRLQCLWMHVHVHVVQITNPITKRVAVRNSFRNVVRSFCEQALWLILASYTL